MARRSCLWIALVVLAILANPVHAVDGDVVFPREGGSTGDTPPTVFPHWVHRIRYACYACHPALFQMKAGADKVTMAAIQEGKFCGACHNGTWATAVSPATCGNCHVAQ